MREFAFPSSADSSAMARAMKRANQKDLLALKQLLETR